MKVESYLFFEGRCEEAVEFYRHELGAEVLFSMRFKENPDEQGKAMIPPGGENKIMHLSMRIGETMIMASDGNCSGRTNFAGFSLAVEVPDEAKAKQFFAALSKGGQVQMPLAKTFFSPLFGMVADKFGVSWMILVRSTPGK